MPDEVYVLHMTADIGVPIRDSHPVMRLSFTEQDYIDDPELENKLNQLLEELSNDSTR